MTTLQQTPTKSSTVVRKRPKSTAGDKAIAGISHTLLTLWSLLVLVPLLWVLMSSFKTSQEIFDSPFSLPTTWRFENYAHAWEGAQIGSYFANSLIVVFGGLFITMLFGSMCAYVLARFEFPGSRIIYWIMLAGLTFPIFLAVVPLFFILKSFGLTNSLFGLMIVYGMFALPFTMFFLYSFFRSLPNSVYEAAQLDGCSEWRTFFQIMLPMAKPGVATVAILNFVGLWNQFLLPIALIQDQNKYVLTQGMQQFASAAGYDVDYGALFAAVVITVVPVLIVYLIFQRQLQGSVSPGTNK